jgi:hypothetical protein
MSHECNIYCWGTEHCQVSWSKLDLAAFRASWQGQIIWSRHFGCRGRITRVEFAPEAPPPPSDARWIRGGRPVLAEDGSLIPYRIWLDVAAEVGA